MRAAIINLLRHWFPHPAVVAKRERRRVAVAGLKPRAQTERERRAATTAKLREELGLPPISGGLN